MSVMERDAFVWAEQTFGRSQLGDARRTNRLVKLAGALAGQVGSSPSRACGGDAAANEGAYRLLRNDAVVPGEMAEGGFAATAEAATRYETLLAVEDTTTLSYEHAVVAELGDLGGDARSAKRGFFVHSVLLLDAESAHTVGLIEQARWRRDSAARGQRHRRRERAYEDKESRKWQQASERMARRLGATMPRVISVCDREADVYEYLKYKRQAAERFVVRAAWDRRVQGEASHLFEAVEQAPVLGEHTVRIAQRGGKQARRGREACLSVRASAVSLRPPRHTGGAGALEVNAVLAQEQAAAPGEEPVCWLLLSSEPVESLAAACQLLHYYTLRWRVEEFHKAWKSGAGVEQRRMQSAENLERMAVVLAFVAVRLLQLRETLDEQVAAKGRAERPCTEVLSATEWKILWVTQERSRPPRRAPSLRWAYESVAKLGGWLDTKRTGRASWQTMWHGWFRLHERVDAYLASRDLM
ncbi:MAG: IS4 family transposase [Gammaproteobacteria bacterium]|nr:IS4 family transposase [Gammaproteobacteria bacterium]